MSVRSSGGALRTAAALLAVAGLTLGGGTFALADETAPAPDEAASVALVVAPRTAVFDETAADYEFSALVDNSGTEQLSAGRLTLELAPQPVAARAELHAEFPEDAVVIAEAEIGATDAAKAQTKALAVERSALPLTGTAQQGVYRIRATLQPGEGAAPVVAQTSFVWQGVPEGTVKLTTIVPLVLPSDIHAMPNRTQLDRMTPRLEELLDAAIEARATLAIDPRLIAGIRAYGDNAPVRSRTFLQRLETTALPSFLLQFADADPAAQAALGYAKLLQPTQHSYATRFGSFPIEPADDGGDEGAAAESEGADTSGRAPTLEQLTDWPQQDPIAWPADGQVDEATLELLRSSGIDTALLSSDNVKLKGGPRASLGSGSALIADSALGEAVRAAIAAQTPTEREAGLSAATAQLAIAAQTGQAGIVVGLDRGAAADGDDPTAPLAQLLALDWVTPAPASEQRKGAATLLPATPDETRLDALREAVEREPEVAELSVLLRRPDDLTSYQRSRLLELFATRHARPEADFASTALAYDARDEEMLKGVHPIGTAHTQLVGTTTQLPLQLRNSLPFEARVTVRVEPASAALVVNEQIFTGVIVGSEGNTRVMVPVHSRVSSGESALDVAVTDASGEFEASSRQLPITIRSGIEKIVLWSLGGIAALLLIFGTIRSLRRRADAETQGDPQEQPTARTE